MEFLRSLSLSPVDFSLHRSQEIGSEVHVGECLKTNGNGKNKGCRRQEEEKKPAGLPLPNVDVCQGRKNTFGSPSDAAAAAAADDEDDEDDEDPSLRDEPNLRRHSRRVVTSVGSGILPTQV